MEIVCVLKQFLEKKLENVSKMLITWTTKEHAFANFCILKNGYFYGLILSQKCVLHLNIFNLFVAIVLKHMLD